MKKKTAQPTVLKQVEIKSKFLNYNGIMPENRLDKLLILLKKYQDKKVKESAPSHFKVKCRIDYPITVSISTVSPQTQLQLIDKII